MGVFKLPIPRLQEKGFFGSQKNLKLSLYILIFSYHPILIHFVSLTDYCMPQTYMVKPFSIFHTLSLCLTLPLQNNLRNLLPHVASGECLISLGWTYHAG